MKPIVLTPLRFIITLLLCCNFVSVQAQDEARETFERSREGFQKAFGVEKKRLSAIYLSQLLALKNKAQQQGNLDGVIILDAEIGRFGELKRIGSGDVNMAVPSLAKLQLAMISKLAENQQSFDTSDADLQEKYLAYLARQEKALVTGGNIAGAKKLRAEAGRIRSASASGASLSVPSSKSLGTTPFRPESIPSVPIPVPGSAPVAPRVIAKLPTAPFKILGTEVAAGKGGLDLRGRFLYAMNFAGPEVTINGLVFSSHKTFAGAGVEISSVHDYKLGHSPAYPRSEPGNAELCELMQTHAWADKRPFVIELPVKRGAAYQLQLIWWDGNSGHNRPGKRVMDISVDGKLLLDDFEVGVTQGSTATKSETDCGIGLIHRFRATSDRVKIELIGTVENAMLAGLSLEGLEAAALMGAVQTVDPPGKHTDRLPEDVGEAKGQWEFRRLETVAVPLLEAELAEWASYERLESNGLGSSRVVRKVHRSGVDLCLQERMARSGPIGVEVAFRGSLKRVEFVASLEARSGWWGMRSMPSNLSIKAETAKAVGAWRHLRINRDQGQWSWTLDGHAILNGSVVTQDGEIDPPVYLRVIPQGELEFRVSDLSF